jgi:hypothetical protein
LPLRELSAGSAHRIRWGRIVDKGIDRTVERLLVFRTRSDSEAASNRIDC